MIAANCIVERRLPHRLATLVAVDGASSSALMLLLWELPTRSPRFICYVVLQLKKRINVHYCSDAGGANAQLLNVFGRNSTYELAE